MKYNLYVVNISHIIIIKQLKMKFQEILKYK